MPMIVALTAMRHDLSHNYRPAAVVLRDALQAAAAKVGNNTEDANGPAVMAAIAEQAVRLHDASVAVTGSAPMVRIPVLKGTITLGDAWAVSRLVAVMQALGYEVDSDVTAAIESIAPAETIPFDDSKREHLDNVYGAGSQADKVLAVLDVLGSGRLDIISNEAIGIAISYLLSAGLEHAAFALARDAILLPPHL
jgi:hypothetical protein